MERRPGGEEEGPPSVSSYYIKPTKNQLDLPAVLLLLLLLLLSSLLNTTLPTKLLSHLLALDVFSSNCTCHCCNDQLWSRSCTRTSCSSGKRKRRRRVEREAALYFPGQDYLVLLLNIESLFSLPEFHLFPGCGQQCKPLLPPCWLVCHCLFSFNDQKLISWRR